MKKLRRWRDISYAWKKAITPISFPRIRITKVQKNTIANYAGSVWSAVMGLVFVPLYIKIMGIESFGLVGVYYTLQGLFVVLDLGLSTTLNRELALLSARDANAQQSRDFVRTLEIIYWGTGILIALCVISCSGLIARHWVKAQGLSPDSVSQTILIMGVAMALQWPFELYGAGLKGLQKQVLWNSVLILGATVRGVGSVLVLWLVSPRVEAFFLWQIAAAALQTAAMAYSLWHSLPQGKGKSRFQVSILRGILSFSGGMTGILVLSTVLSQADKVVLSKLLSLEDFGYYTLAWNIASVMSQMVVPVVTSVFPRFSELVSRADDSGLRDLYHKGCQMVTWLTVPAAALVSAFAGELIFLWMGNQAAAQNAGPILSLLAVGLGLGAQGQVPGVLQLAYGWTRLGLVVSAVAVVVFVPLLVWIAGLYGGIGAAALWIALNGVGLMVAVPVMHTRLLKGEFRRWCLRDLGLPAVVAIAVVLTGRKLMPLSMSNIGLLVYFAAIFAAALGATLLAAPLIRQEAVSAIGRRRL